MITLQAAKDLLEGLRMIQYRIYDYDAFVRVMKRRIMRYTGDTSIMFADEKTLVLRLGELGILKRLERTTAAK